MKTLLSVRAEKNKVFDGSTKGSPIQIFGDIIPSKENILKVKKGYLEVGLLPALGKNNSFTLEATLNRDLEPVGTQGFKIGTSVDGKAYQFQGEIGNINIKAGAFSAKDMSTRIKVAKSVEVMLKTKLGPFAHVFVNPSLDESHARLQP